MDFADAKEEIRERLDLVEVIGQYVRLRRVGRRFTGLCPFHQDSAPSFSVDPERGFWHCFGCGEGGDLFAFIMRQEGLDFAEALRMLAQRAGVQLSSDPQAEGRRRHRELLERANRIAREHFVRNLHEHPAAAAARDYVRRRGLNKWAVHTFEVGFALDSWDDLLNTLAAEGINATVAQEAGLAKPGERGGSYDTFRDRIIFPISDVTGRTIAFGGRAMDPENPAKYLNSPETPLFLKRRALYALDLARQAIGQQRRAIIVEGYTDVISLHQAGIGNVVAGLGTALTKEQLDLLGRYAEEVVLVYDADAAGERAALRNIEVVEGAEVAVSLITLPAGQDPDDFVRAHGPEAFMELLEGRISPIEYELRLIFEEHSAQSADGQARAAQAAVDVLLKLSDWTRRDEFVSRAADLWGRRNPGRTESMERVLKLELTQRLRDAGRDRRRLSSDPSFISQTLTRGGGGLLRAETELLAEALDDEQMAARVLAELEPGDMLTEADAAILAAMKEQQARDGKLDARALVDALPEEGGARQRGVELTVAQVRRIEPESDADRLAQTEETILRLRSHRASAGRPALSQRATEALPDGGLSRDELAALELRVHEGLNSGELAHDDPLVQQYLDFRRRLHGRGGGGFVGEPGGGGALPGHARPPGGDRPADDVAARAERRTRVDADGPADRAGAREPADPWALDEEGDPFSEDD